MNTILTLISKLPHYKHRMACYKQQVCPSCKEALQWLPEAPGSDEGKYCQGCDTYWIHEDSHRTWARVDKVKQK